jgi:diaminohydroxyphosphoribosylaminopyrimidine deaminase / 5-amino-6-(5-phosphoribosylamino)uracil reductase
MNSQAYKKSSSDWSIFDHEMMSLALQLAKKGEYTARPNPMVGCVLVKDNQIIGQGWHQKSGLAHAEINALKASNQSPIGSTCYVTLEPCAHIGKTGPCAKALIKSGVSKVVAAMLDPNPNVAGKGFQLLIDAGIQVEYGLLENQAMKLNEGFVSRFSRNRPWLTCKLAMSLDGRTALADGSSQWITSSAARKDVQKLRARQDAIITGIGTVLRDDPSLNVRAEDDCLGNDWFAQANKLGFSQPARILLDRNSQADALAKIFNNDAEVYWLCDSNKREPVSEHISHLKSFKSLQLQLEYFAKQGMNNLLLEAGHRLAGEYLKQGLIDELVVYMAPKLMGSSAMGLFELDVKTMSSTPILKLNDVRQIGDDVRLTYCLDNQEK